MALVGAPTPRRHISYGSSELVPVAGSFFLCKTFSHSNSFHKSQLVPVAGFFPLKLIKIKNLIFLPQLAAADFRTGWGASPVKFLL